MVLAPSRATLALTFDGTAVLGVLDAPITDKVTMQDITCDADAAIRRFPTTNDADFKATIVFDAADAGQDKIRAAKASHVAYAAVLTVTPAVFTMATVYVESIAYTKGPKDVLQMDVVFAVSGGVAVSGT